MNKARKTNLNLENLAFVLKELSKKVKLLNETELETLEIMLDDEIMEVINNPSPMEALLTYEEVFGYPKHIIRTKSSTRIKKVSKNSQRKVRKRTT